MAALCTAADRSKPYHTFRINDLWPRYHPGFVLGRAMRKEAEMTLETQALAADGCAALPADEMMVQAEAAAAFLKALAHEGRLMILCHLQSGEKSVTELEHLLSSRQAAVSQQLARLRLEELVSSRRDGKTIYYSIQDPKVATAIGMVYEMFCKPK